MAAQFFSQLQTVSSGNLPNGAECMICWEEYGTVSSDSGVIEHAVFLPCLHHVGSECIAVWLSPDGGQGNSCPMCRNVFFPAQTRYDDGDDENDDEEDEDEEDEDDHVDGYSDSDEDGSEDGDEDEDEDGDGPDEADEADLREQ